MIIDILTLFPDLFSQITNVSILGRAQKTGAVTICVHNLRNWTDDKYGTVDDTPYGGGPGMVMKVDVVDRALAALLEIRESPISHRPWIILLTPQGRTFSQGIACELVERKHLILIAGHYEGFDERIRALVDEEISIGDYVLTGGELPVLVVTDAVVRLLPGVLGDASSPDEESFSLIDPNTRQPLIEYPHYTRPESYQPTSITFVEPLAVPPILLSGHHQEIQKWRLEQARQRTKTRRPNLVK